MKSVHSGKEGRQDYRKNNINHKKKVMKKKIIKNIKKNQNHPLYLYLLLLLLYLQLSGLPF